MHTTICGRWIRPLRRVVRLTQVLWIIGFACDAMIEFGLADTQPGLLLLRVLHAEIMFFQLLSVTVAGTNFGVDLLKRLPGSNRIRDDDMHFDDVVESPAVDLLLGTP